MSSEDDLGKLRRNRWYFGGLASAAAAFLTHPMDVIKVHLQTHQDKHRISMFRIARHIVAQEGIAGIYNGLSASLFRQLTYTTVRMGIYEEGKNYMNTNSVGSGVALALIAGSCGGFIGVPSDKVNVRLQNDMKLPPEKRYNYKHVFDGLSKIYRNEGFVYLFSGASMAITRGILITIGQNVVYDQTKLLLLSTPYFDDDVATHFTASNVAGAACTLLTQPIDVMKTRVMSAKPGTYANSWQLILDIAKSGPLGFFKGFIPALLRPMTMITYLIMEQMRIHFGYLPDDGKEQPQNKKMEWITSSEI